MPPGVLDGVGGVVNGCTPVDELPVLVEGDDGDVGHGAIAGGSVPVVNAWFEEGLTGCEGLGFLAFELVNADAGGHHNKLADVVGMPVSAGFGLEGNSQGL